MPVNSFDDYPMNWRPTLTDRRPPIYRRLAKQLAADIRAGRLKPGDKLPPQRELADFLDVHLSTITRTYKLCEEQGLICAKVGQGTFVASDVATTDTLLYSQTPRDLIQMGTVLPPYEGNAQMIAFIRQCLQQPDIHHFLEYQAPLGTATQRRVFCQWLASIGVVTAMDALLFATGAQNALCAAFLGCFKAGDRVGTMALTFPGLKGIAKMVGVQLVPLPEKNGHLQLDALAAFCQREHLCALYLISDQHNPTTVSLSDEERRFLGALAQTHNLLLIEDAINRPFCEDALPPLHAYAPQHTLFILSVSKFLGAGLRVAVVVAPPDYRGAIETALYNMNLMVSPFNLELTGRLLQSSLWPTLSLKSAANCIGATRSPATPSLLTSCKVRPTAAFAGSRCRRHGQASALKTQLLGSAYRFFAPSVSPPATRHRLPPCACASLPPKPATNCATACIGCERSLTPNRLHTKNTAPARTANAVFSSMIREPSPLGK